MAGTTIFACSSRTLPSQVDFVRENSVFVILTDEHCLPCHAVDILVGFDITISKVGSKWNDYILFLSVS